MLRVSSLPRVIRTACFFSSLLFSAMTFSYDPHVSLSANATALGFLKPGGTFEYATTANKRTVVAAQLGITDAPSNGDPRELYAGLNGRLLYSAGLSSQWYPMAYTRAWLNDQSFDTGMGVGIQFQTTNAIGLYTETLWSIQRQQVHHTLGIRVWLGRFSSLDSRVKRSEPIGAVYSLGSRETVRAQPPKPNIPSPEPTAVSESTAVTITPLALNGIEEVQWYAHLGLFSKLASMEQLAQDLRLQPYQERIVRWYDNERLGYRLLIGPYSELAAKAVVQELQLKNIESFVYQKPSGLEAQ